VSGARPGAETIDAAIARVEARTGVQIVTAVVARADSYAELPWIAFALGAGLGALAVVLFDVLAPVTIAHGIVLAALALLVAGAASALAAVLVPGYARLFLRRSVSARKVRRCAQSLFQRREVGRTRARTGILILVCKFERRVEILPDAGFYGRVGAQDWERIGAAMAPLARQRRFADALHAGVALAGQILAARGFARRAGGADELPDGSIEEQGPS
jgi:putative membrane protein